MKGTTMFNTIKSIIAEIKQDLANARPMWNHVAN
jgi:hypothetical protein